jgi:DNA sulfur modification protein DndD
MPTSLRIAGWKSEGLRCPDHEVSFLKSPGNVYPVSLIQMPNGTGKTTTLQLLRAALSGMHPSGEWTPDEVRKLRKHANGNDSGKFQVTLLDGSRRVTITLFLDFEEGAVRYATTLTSGQKDGFHPPRDLERFLRPDFVNLFIFDGELAEHLLDHDRTDAQSALEDLFQLRVFLRITDRVQEYWTVQTRTTSASEERGLARRRNRVTKLRERIKNLEVEQSRLFPEYERTLEQLDAKKKRFNAALSQHDELSERLRRAEQRLTETRSGVQQMAREVFAKMRDPHALSAKFAEEMLELKQSLDRVKLPESTAREFFEELAGEDVCVCGRPLDDVTRDAIRDRAKLYLGSDNVALLNAIKGDVSLMVQPNTAEHEQELQTLMKRLGQNIRAETEARTEKDLIEAEAQNDPRLEEIKSEIDMEEDRLEKLKMELDKFVDPTETAGDEEVFGIEVLKQRLRNAERKLAEITETLDLKSKRDILVAILQSAHTRARNAISDELCNEANERINRIMPFNAIRIEKLERCLRLTGQEGGSVGETLSIAYGFLATLFNRTDYELPFIVDSPANPIDLRIRPRIAELIPSLTKQFVAFIISSERQSFVEPLEKKTSGGVQFITLFRRGPKDLEVAALKENAFQKSADGISVAGRAFFSAFHLDEEDGKNGV